MDARQLSGDALLYNKFHLPLMEDEETVFCIRRIKDGDPEEGMLRRKIVLQNQGLVRTFAKRLMGRGVSYADLVQEGMIGINRAIDGFEESKETKFSTYAVYWIRERMQRAIADYGRTIRIPVHQFERAQYLAWLQRELHKKHGREPTIYDIYCAAKAEQAEKNDRRAQEGKMDQELLTLFEIRSALFALGNNPLSLDQEASGDGNDSRTMYDFLSDSRCLSPEDLAHFQSLYEKICLFFSHVHHILKGFSVRESEILICRFGLGENSKKTLQVLGDEWGVGRERIRQLEKKALRKLEAYTNLSSEEMRRLLLAREEIECILAA